MNFKDLTLKRKWWMAGCCLLIMSINTSKAQYFSMDIGYTGNKIKMAGLNEVINKYNTNRPYLNKELGNINYLDGFTMGMGYGVDHFLMDFRLSFSNAKRYATGEDRMAVNATGAEFRRDLKVTQRTGVFSLGFGDVYSGSNVDIGFVLGFRSEVGYTKIFSRVYQDGNDAPDYDDTIIDEIFFRMGPTLITLISPYEGVLIQVHTYYLHSLFSWDAYSLDKKFHGGDPKETENPNHGLGFCLTFGIGTL